MNLFRLPLFCIAATTLASVSFAQTTFDTMSSWDGGTAISSFGNPDSATYGQTFLAPTDSKMLDYSFQLLGSTGTTFQLRGMLFDWTGSLTGPGGGGLGSAIYTSAPIVVNGNGAFQQVTINPNMNLIPGHSYVAAISVSDPTDYDATTGTGSVGFNWYSHGANNGGGGFVWSNNGNDVSALSSGWSTWNDFGDAAYTAHFASAQAVPEPASMLALGGGALAVLRRRRKARQA